MSGTPQDAGTEPVVIPQVTIDTPTEGDKTPAKAEDKTPEAATEGEPQDGTKTTDEGQDEAPKRRDGGFQRRINRLTADYRAAEARAAAAEAKAAELERKQSQPAQSDDLKPPRVEDFKTYEEYERADRAHIAEQTRRQTLKELDDRQARTKAEDDAKAEAKRIREARERFDKAADDIADQYEGFDDFIDDLSRGHTPLRDLDQDALEQIFEHDDPKVGAALAFHLHTHPDEAKRIAGLVRSKQVRELAKLEASLPKPTANTATKAPEPPKRVKAGGGPDGKDISQWTIEDHRRATKTVPRVRD